MTTDFSFKHGDRVTVAYDDGTKVLRWHGSYYASGLSGAVMVNASPGLPFRQFGLPTEGEGYRMSERGILIEPNAPGWSVSLMDEMGERLLIGQTDANIKRAQILSVIFDHDRTLRPVLDSLNDAVNTLIIEAYERGRAGEPMPTPHGPVTPSGR